MSIEAICALPVSNLAEPDAHLFLWIPDTHLIEGHGAAVVRAWGFEPGRLIIWRKAGYALGRFPRPQHEALLVCRRGSLAFRVADAGSVQDWKQPYEGGARKHSAKPDGALDLIERASPGPYLELFARSARFGWDYAGDQSLGTVELSGLRAPERKGAHAPPPRTSARTSSTVSCPGMGARPSSSSGTSKIPCRPVNGTIGATGSTSRSTQAKRPGV